MSSNPVYIYHIVLYFAVFCDLCSCILQYFRVCRAYRDPLTLIGGSRAYLDLKALLFNINKSLLNLNTYSFCQNHQHPEPSQGVSIVAFRRESNQKSKIKNTQNHINNINQYKSFSVTSHISILNL